MPYTDVVFMQGDEASEPLAILHNRPRDPETGMDASTSVVWECPTAESVAATIAYLAQWDYGDRGDAYDDSHAGSGDWQETDGHYLLTYNVGLSYIGLERVETVTQDA